MCELMTALALAGTVASVAGSIYQGKTAAATGQLQQEAYNVQAENTQKAATFEAMQTLRKQEAAAAQARAQVGASGVAFEGSPTAALVSNAQQGALDIEAIKFGSQVKSDQLTTQGKIARYSGDRAETGSYIAGASTLASGTGRAIYMNKTSPFSNSTFES
jgi:hypothetical protein